MIDFKNCPKEEVWELCGPDGERRLLKNETELTFARMMIARDALEGYYVRRPFQVGVWNINKYGVIESRDGYPYEEHDKMSAKIIRFAMMTRSEELGVEDELSPFDIAKEAKRRTEEFERKRREEDNV